MSAAWDRVNRFYKKNKKRAVEKYPGMYLLVHVETLLCAVGDPSKDACGGYEDAFRKLWAHYGVLYGEYFGVLIPTTN